jgi:hypothetical protein
MFPHGLHGINYRGAMIRMNAVRAFATATVSAHLVACSGGDAPKAWSALATCLAGPAAGAPVVERVQKLRSAELAATASAKDAWPARCSSHADALYAASGDLALVHRTLKERLGCKDDGHCAIVADESFLPSMSALWEAAQAAKLTPEAAAGVPAPALSPPPLIDATSWKSFSKDPARVVGPRLQPDGSALLLLAAKEGRARPRYCRLSAGFATMQCSDANASVPELPGQTVGLPRGGRGVFVAGLTEAGMSAYNLETGARSDVRGKSPYLVVDGVAIETPTEEAPGAKGAPAPNPKAPPPPAPKGFVAVEIVNGKSSKEAKLSIDPVGTPVPISNQVVYVQGDGPSASLEAKAFSHGHLGGGASIKGPFVGRMHTCTTDNRTAVATFDGYANQQSAKATGGPGKTQFAIAFKTGDTWSKAQSATLPFDRSLDSDLVCSKTGASVAWVRRNADVVEVGRLDCSEDGCKPEVVSLPGLESKWWGGVAPLGDKVLLFWRSTLGETRLRVAPLATLAQAPDQLLFDSADFGGPVAGEPLQVTTEAAALFVFAQERPVALRIGADGHAAVLAP